MGFKVPDSLADSGGISVEGEGQISAFDNILTLSGNPPGTLGQVLTSNGGDGPPTWEDATGGGGDGSGAALAKLMASFRA